MAASVDAMTAVSTFAILTAIGLSSCNQDTSQGSLSSYSANSTAQAHDKPMWVVDPTEPGPDHPPIGRSLFDYLVTERKGNITVYTIPFPFSALVRKIEQQISAESEGSPLKKVLIPLNRSLQRNSAGPDFFKYPRAVLAVDTEPLPQAGSSGMLLKDRLFLGYQEKAGIIEVISYNEAAGRFEFQVVSDYRPGGIPKVLYANRALCTVCHQNHSPIFSKPLWDETNANPSVAALLAAQRRDFYGFRIHQGIDIPQAIDDSTDRANGFSASQLLWQDGCERADSAASIACRADLLGFVLQYLLSGGRQPDNRSSDFTDRFALDFLKHWQAQWPQGLLISDSDIFNRNPLKIFPQLFALPGTGQEQAVPFDLGYDRSAVRSLYEPSIFRHSKATWSASEGPRVLARLITGLSRFLADADIRHLDQYLIRHGSVSVENRRYEADCRYSRQPDRSTERLSVQCSGPTHADGARKGFSMDGVIDLKAGKVTGGTIDHLSFEEGDDLIDLAVTQEDLISRTARQIARLEVAQKPSGHHARRTDGNAVKEIILHPLPPLPPRGGGIRRGGDPSHSSGSATVTVLDDFSLVPAAIEAMARDTKTGTSDALARKPFRRARVMEDLYRHLQMPPRQWCCVDDRGMTAPLLSQHSHEYDPAMAVVEQGAGPAMKSFVRYCAACHHEEEPFPPNFLHGKGQQVKTQVDHCAERIFFRLDMWRLPEADRPEAPMPPVAALQRLHLTPEQWSTHADLAVLKNYAAEILKSKNRKTPQMEHFVPHSYDDLPDCLPTS